MIAAALLILSEQVWIKLRAHPIGTSRENKVIKDMVWTGFLDDQVITFSFP